MIWFDLVGLGWTRLAWLGWFVSAAMTAHDVDVALAATDRAFAAVKAAHPA